MKGVYAAAVATYKVAADGSTFQSDDLQRQIALSVKGVSTGTQLDAVRNTARRAAEQASLAQVAVAKAGAALGGDPDIDTDSLALLPPMLSRIFGYPTITTGLVMGPRGVGTMASMLIVGRLMRSVDPRAMVMLGLIFTAGSLYFMTGFSPQMGAGPVIWTGVLQGLGLGLVFVPLSTIAFSTIDAKYRADATSLFSLVRNIGSSIGISVVSVMLSRNIQVNHVELAAFINPFNPVLWNVSPAAASGNLTVLTQFDGLVNQQAALISYIDDFKLMMLVTLCAISFALTLKKPRSGRGQPLRRMRNSRRSAACRRRTKVKMWLMKNVKCLMINSNKRCPF